MECYGWQTITQKKNNKPKGGGRVYSLLARTKLLSATCPSLSPHHRVGATYSTYNNCQQLTRREKSTNRSVAVDMAFSLDASSCPKNIPSSCRRDASRMAYRLYDVCVRSTKRRRRRRRKMCRASKCTRDAYPYIYIVWSIRHMRCACDVPARVVWGWCNEFGVLEKYESRKQTMCVYCSWTRDAHTTRAPVQIFVCHVLGRQRYG